jgi:hypothetical protein
VALESREEMVNQANSDLARHQETLNLCEASLQERMDRMLNQQRISLEQEFEQRRAKNLEACRADFRSKTKAALVRYKPRCKTRLGRSRRHNQHALA